MTSHEEGSPGSGHIDPIWKVERASDADRLPVMALAIHSGHRVRDEVASLLSVTDEDRLREEDPFTEEWTRLAPTRVIGLASRFQVDLNRHRERAVYLRPEDAWGLDLWRVPPSNALIERSLAEYDAFYGVMAGLLERMRARFGRFVVFDLHSYNHRRAGPAGPPADTASDPQVNVGTGTMDRSRWSALVDRFVTDLRRYDFPLGGLDVRENVKFRGGNLARWIHATYPEAACVLSIEVKKFFMDEWTGTPDRSLLDAIGVALVAIVPSVLEELQQL